MTQAVPRRLHSSHTLCPGIRGCLPASNADSSSSSWPLSIGQPRSSKSTRTWLAIGVEVASVAMYSGRAYTAARNSATSAKLRSAWTPPEVAHAPMVTSILDCARICWIRAASWGVVTDPSTSETS